MKQLILISTLLILACTSDNSESSNQTFFEKYHSVVWQEDTPFDYLNRIQINNGDIITVNNFFVEDNYEDCFTETILNSDLIEVNEDSFRLSEESEYNGITESWVTTVTATNNGNTIIVEYSYEPELLEYFSRTTLSTPCE